MDLYLSQGHLHEVKCKQSRIWIRVGNSISYEDNHYATSALSNLCKQLLLPNTFLILTSFQEGNVFPFSFCQYSAILTPLYNLWLLLFNVLPVSVWRKKPVSSYSIIHWAIISTPFGYFISHWSPPFIRKHFSWFDIDCLSYVKYIYLLP